MALLATTIAVKARSGHGVDSGSESSGRNTSYIYKIIYDKYPARKVQYMNIIEKQSTERTVKKMAAKAEVEKKIKAYQLEASSK